ncbi:DUF4880 domain-containing protein [Pseudomonas sp. S37]|uniref:FecR domain-containing protein n=1 Tax=Pseudomonas sp. S37 TaxID=2767449 RepID=UPI00191266D2|nr:FecR domain-containing protein [Pseudomonas sp. S37]MBK4997034.1 DUF4880 domain-containing protein [Pseudomonas sp. S37]
MTSHAVSRPVAQQAARWFLCLQGGASEDERQACAAWRAADSEHERAWQLATRFSAQVQSIPPDVARATLQRPAALGRRAAVKALTSLVVLGSLGVALSRTGTVDTLLADARTAVGEQRRLTLDDGTELHLNTDTAVDIRYSAGERLLVLRRGELYVSTGKDPRPMLVHSAWGMFQPLGTRFAVRQYEQHDELKVLEGTVAATPRAGATLRIEAGEQALVSATRVTRLNNAPAKLDWVEGMLRVERMPLVDFLAELGRYRHGWVRCAPEVAQLEISGVYQLADSDAALRALAMAFPLRVNYLSRYWVTVVPAGA